MYKPQAVPTCLIIMFVEWKPGPELQCVRQLRHLPGQL